MAAEEEDSFRILVATDTHLGYAEKHPVRGDDSFRTFEEVLELAVEQSVDFILLGGDLFHENRPSRQAQVRCMDLLQKYTFGDRPVHFNLLSDPVINFPHRKQVNYLDPNLNVSMPVFSIHGNHDDPAGLGFLCALEMLSSAGLINYFGRVTDLSDVKVSPILLQKGTAKLALYGLCSVKDERLHRLFVENKVKMLRPKESLKEWFNMMVVHQNRAKRGPSNYLPESFLDSFLDLVIWGHEHDCIKEPWQSSQNYHILQPGSSVATSLTPGEAIPKCAFLLQVNSQHQFKVDPLPLKTVRPFLFQEVVLSDFNLEEEVARIERMSGSTQEDTEQDMMDGFWDTRGRAGRGRKATGAPSQSQKKVNPVEVFIEHYVREKLKNYKDLLTGHPRQPTLPLVRVRVIYTEENQHFNVCRFGYKFDGLVANPEDLVSFVRQKTEKDADGNHPGGIPDIISENAINTDDVDSCVEHLVEEIFRTKALQDCEMRLLTERGISTAVRAFVQKEDKNAVVNMIEYQMRRMQEHILSLDKDYGDEDDLEADILAFRTARNAEGNLQKEEDEILAALKLTKHSQSSSVDDFDMDEDNIETVDDLDDDSDSDREFAAASRGRGSRGRGGRGSRGGSRGTTTTPRGRGARGRSSRK